MTGQAAYSDRLIYHAWDKQSSPAKYRSTSSVRLSTDSESSQIVLCYRHRLSG